MRGTFRLSSALLTLACVAVAAGIALAWGIAEAGAGTAAPTPPVLYAGASSSLGGSVVVGSPLSGGKPTAALYINGTLTLSGSANVTSTVQYIAAKGAAVPALSTFMPATRLTQLTQASQTAQETGTVYNGLTLSGSGNATYSSPITVNGNLAISGSGTFTFNSVYVTGNVSIANSAAKVSFASLYVGGALSATGATSLSLGPTFVAGDTSFSISGQCAMAVPKWTMGLLVIGGNLTVGGSGSYGGDGVGSDPRPITVLMTGSNKTITLSGTPTISGLLYDASGALKDSSGGGSVKGTVLCGGGVTASGSLAVNYNANEAVTTLDTTPPTATASLSPTANANGWNNTCQVTATLTPTDNSGGSGVASTSYTLTGVTASGTNVNLSGTGTSVKVTPAGTYTLTYWSTDKAGNVEAGHSLPVKIDTVTPTVSVTTPASCAVYSASGTTPVPKSFTGAASDAASGVATVTCQLKNTTNCSSPLYWNGSTWQSNPCTVAATYSGGAWSCTAPSTWSDGTYALQATATDKAGNSTTSSVCLTYDATAPSLSVKTPVGGTFYSAAGTTRAPASFAGSASDATSGVATVTYTLKNTTTGLYWNGSKWGGTACSVTGAYGWGVWSAAAPTSWSDGTYSLQAVATDRAGNSTQSGVSFTYDATRPLGSLTINGGAAYTNQMAVTLNPSAQDVLSGVILMQFTNVVTAQGQPDFSGSPWAPYSSTPYPWTLASGDGAKTVYAQYKDAAGNISATVSASVTLDATPPTVTGVSSTAPDGTYTVGAVIPVTVAFSEPVTVTGTPQLSLATGSPSGTSVGYSSGSGTATLTFDYKVGAGDVTPDLNYLSTGALTLGGGTIRDAAANNAVLTLPGIGASGSLGAGKSIVIEASAPTMSLTSMNGSSTGYNEPVFDYGAKDALGNPLIATLIVDAKAVAGAASGKPLPQMLGDGSHTVTVTATDAAGNVGSRQVAIDVEAPPFTIQPATPAEGDTIGLYADSTAATGNPSGSWDGKDWKWTITESGDGPVTLDGPVAFATLPDPVGYRIQLSVTDQATGAICATDGTVTAQPAPPRVHALAVDALAGQPVKLFARFLDPGWAQTHTATWSVNGVQVGGTVTEDNAATMNSGFVTGVIQQLPAGTYPDSRLTVTDSKGQSTTATFAVTVRQGGQGDLNAYEGAHTNDTFDNATPLTSGQATLSYIQSARDVDIYEVKLPATADNPDGVLPYGTEVLATLRDMPADYDLAVVQDLGKDVDAGEQSAAFDGSSFANAATLSSWVDAGHLHGTPYADVGHLHGTPYYDLGHLHGTPFVDVGHLHGTPFLDSAYLDAGHLHGTPFDIVGHLHGTPYVRDPLLSMLYADQASTTTNPLDGYSFSDMSFTELGDNTPSGQDITFEELGFDNQDMQGKQIAGFSAANGTGDDVVLANTDFVGGHTYVLVKGANGAFSDQPYTLQVETSAPIDTPANLNAGNTSEGPKVRNGTSTPPSPWTPSSVPKGTNPQTLFVVQPERIEAIYGTQAWTGLDTTLQAASASSYTGYGTILTLPSTIYDSWDTTPWDPTLANDVTQQIRSYIDDYLYGGNGHPAIKYVVLVGGDEVIPQRRVPDGTVLGNEAAYADTSYLKADSPLLASMFDSMVLTDDYYVDAHPIGYGGHELYIPDLAVSRLVETPSEIENTINTFLSNDGTLDGGSSVVTGQDFMSDGAQRVDDILANAKLSPTLETPDSWTAADLQRDMLDKSADVTDVNAHFTHFEGISAAGYDQPAGSDLSNELIRSTAFANAFGFSRKLVFSMGCHIGLNVPDDEVALAADSANDFNPSLDFAQAMAEQQGVLLGSTGYGFGDTETIAGTEALVGNFADQATTADSASKATGTGQPIGLALAAAKRQYLGTLSAVTPYDEKSSIEFTMYGMPQYRLTCTTHDPDTGLQANGVASPADAGLSLNAKQSLAQQASTAPSGFDLTVDDADGQTQYKTDLGEVTPTDGSGSYFTAALTKVIASDGTATDVAGKPDNQATADRAIQPRLWIPLPAKAMPWTAALVTAGSYVDLTGFDPVIARVTDGEEVDPSEFQMATQGWWPSDPVTLTTITDGQGNDQQWLVVQPGQFERNSAPGAATVTGTERLWSDLTVKLIKRPANADPNDTVGPTVHSVTLSNDGTTWTAVVDAEDASGIGSIDVTEIGAGDANDHDFPISSTDTNPYSVHFPVSGSQTQDVSMLIAVTDNAGHTTTVTAKGSLWSASAHAITAGASAGGSISPVGGVIVNDGGDQTFAITPAAHHHVVDVTVDGTSRGAIASYTFSGVTADHAITATFAIDQENLNVTTAGQGNVAVSPSQPTYDYGSTVTLTATPASGWQFDHWGGDASGSASPLTVTMNSDRKVSATFVPSGSAFQVTTLAGSVGTAGSADGTGSAAQFNWPSGVCCDAVGNVYVGDDWNNTVRKITPDGVVTTLAGSAAGIAGSTDGTGSTARFDHPMGVVCDPAGDVFVADSWNYVIREITPGGVVTTYAGSAGNPGSADGSLTTARFDHPTDLAIDGVGNLYVTDYYNSTIRKITPGGVVSTLAGSAGQTGTADGTGSQARFNNPSGLACDGAGNVYVADTYNQTIRKITPGGVVSTLAGSPGAQGSTDGTGGAALFYQPAGVACDAAGNVYVADYDNNTIREITPAGVVTTVAGSAGVTGSTDGTGSAASFNLTRAIACDAVGNLYVADVGNSTIRKASCPATVGGWLRVVQGAHGTISLDGQTGAAPAAVPVQHGHSQAFAIIPDAYYRTSDVEVDGGSESRIAGYGFNDVVQDHTIAATFSSVVVGSEAGSLGPGSSDGVGPGAEFRYPYAVACEQGYVYVADSANDTIRKVTPSGVVTTVAGTAGSPGSADGNGGAASFDFPEGIACDSAGNIYVADSLNDTIRRISSGGDVTTIAGTPGVAGSADGTGPAASFSEPCGLACDSAGDIYVADRKNFTIRKVTPSGVVTTLAGSPGAYGCSDGVGSSATFAYPQAVACDSAGNVYVADYDYSIIRKITPSGVVTTIAGSAGHPGFADGVGTAAQFDGPCGIACDSYDNLYVADTLGDEVRMITPTGVVVTLAGSGGVAGSTDGNGATARFKYPRGIACTNAGIVFIADTNNQMIRVLGP